MKRFPHLLAFLFLLNSSLLVSQNAPVSTAGTTITPGSTVTVPVTVTGFSNIGSFNLLISYDSTIAIATNVFAGPSLGGMFYADYTSIHGMISIGWFAVPSVNMANNATLFSISFARISTGTTQILWLDDGSSCQYSNGSYVVLTDTPTANFYINGRVSFQGPAPQTFAPTMPQCPGTLAEIPITVSSFTNIGGYALMLSYDPGIITYQGFINNAGFQNITVDGSVPGQIVMTASVPAIGLPVSLADNATLITLQCMFNGGGTMLSWVDNGASCQYQDPPPWYVNRIDNPTQNYYNDGAIYEVPVPTTALSGTATICNGQSTDLSFSLTGSPPWSLVYSDGTNTFTQNLIVSSPYIKSVSPSVSTTYTIVSVNDINCGALPAGISGQADVTVNTRPSVAISGNNTICLGQSANLNFNLTGTAPWSITYTNGTTAVTLNGIVTNPYVLSISPTATKTYTVTALSDAHCQALPGDISGSAVITVKARPAATITGSTSVCSGTSASLHITLTGSGTISGNLSDGTPFSGTSPSVTLTVTPLSTTTYTIVNLTDANCSALPSDLLGGATIVVNMIPLAEAGSDQTINYGTTTQLQAAPGGWPACAYHWSPDAQVDSPHSQMTQTHQLTSSTVFNLVVTDSLTGCNSNDLVILTVTGGPLNTAPIALQDSLCMGDSTLLYANAGGGSGNYTYHWYSPSIANPAWQSSLPDPWITGTTTSSQVILVVHDGFNYDTVQFPLTVHPRPEALISGTDTLCEGDSTLIHISLTGTPPFQFVLVNGSNCTPFNNIPGNTLDLYTSYEGTYLLGQLSDLHCGGTVSGYAGVVVYTYPETPVISISGNSITSSAPSGNQWYGAGGPIPGATGQAYVPTWDDHYYVIVKNHNCASPLSNTIHFIAVGINEHPDDNTGILIYPNPARDYIIIRSGLPYSTETTLQLLSVTGQLFLRQSLMLQSGRENMVHLPRLSPGIYYITLNNNIYSFKSKIIVR